MSSYIDKIEENLRQKIDVLEKAYESDVRFEHSIDVSDGALEQYDEYLEEQNSYLSMLDDLDTEYDRIYDLLSSHKEELATVDPAVKTRLNSIIKEVEGKLQAVREAEGRVKDAVETYFKNRKSKIAVSRRNTRVIQSNYGANPSLANADHSMFDVSH